MKKFYVGDFVKVIKQGSISEVQVGQILRVVSVKEFSHPDLERHFGYRLEGMSDTGGNFFWAEELELSSGLGFTLDDIKVGYLVKTRNNGFFMKMPYYDDNSYTLIDSLGDFLEIGNYHYNLIEGSVNTESIQDGWAIVEVYGFSSRINKALEFTTDHRPLIWKAPAKEFTVKELEEILGYEIKVKQCI